MFPPVEQKVLQNNPEFAKLYRILTTTVLNPDGSTKDDPEARDRAVVQKKLDEHRQKAARHHLLERAIATATPPEPKASSSSSASSRLTRAGERLQQRLALSTSDSVSEELLDLLLILPPFLNSVDTLPNDSVALLLSSPPLSHFETLLPDLADLISSNLHTSALGLTRIIHPSTNSAYLHRHIASLPKDFANLTSSLSAAEEALKEARLRAIASLTDLLQIFSECLTCLVRSLEAKHGVIARSLELRASDVSLEAQRVEKQAEQIMWRLRKEVYTPDSVSALQNYIIQLKDAKARTAEKIRVLQADLDAHTAGARSESREGTEKEMALTEIAGAYKDMEKQMEDTQEDIGRLRLS